MTFQLLFVGLLQPLYRVDFPWVFLLGLGPGWHIFCEICQKSAQDIMARDKPNCATAKKESASIVDNHARLANLCCQEGRYLRRVPKDRRMSSIRHPKIWMNERTKEWIKYFYTTLSLHKIPQHTCCMSWPSRYAARCSSLFCWWLAVPGQMIPSHSLWSPFHSPMQKMHSTQS